MWLQCWTDDKWSVVYACRTLKDAERNDSVIEKECLAVVWSIKECYKYLHGKRYTV